jgi:hypothetical protein
MRAHVGTAHCQANRLPKGKLVTLRDTEEGGRR